jgi:hypothetical protein
MTAGQRCLSTRRQRRPLGPFNRPSMAATERPKVDDPTAAGSAPALVPALGPTPSPRAPLALAPTPLLVALAPTPALGPSLLLALAPTPAVAPTPLLLALAPTPAVAPTPAALAAAPALAPTPLLLALAPTPAVALAPAAHAPTPALAPTGPPRRENRLFAVG